MKNRLFDAFYALSSAYFGVGLAAWELRFWLWRADQLLICWFMAVAIFVILRVNRAA